MTDLFAIWGCREPFLQAPCTNVREVAQFTAGGGLGCLGDSPDLHKNLEQIPGLHPLAIHLPNPQREQIQRVSEYLPELLLTDADQVPLSQWTGHQGVVVRSPKELFRHDSLGWDVIVWCPEIGEAPVALKQLITPVIAHTLSTRFDRDGIGGMIGRPYGKWVIEEKKSPQPAMNSWLRG